MPTPCESWPRRLASTRLAATCAASPSFDPAAATIARTAAPSASARKVKVSVMSGIRKRVQPKRNKRGVHLLFARLRDGGVAQSGLSQTVRRAAIMHKLLAVAFLAASFAGPAGADTAEATQVLQQRTA